MRQRRALYRKGWISDYAPSCPCVSVGNISWGGTGKTPLTSWLLEWAQGRGLKAVVLMRGYRGKPGRRPLLVRRDTPVEQTGDEPLLLARAFPQASVVVFPRRSEAARFAENYLEPDLLILDDGMQHLNMRRDADIVLLRPEDFYEEWDRVIPSGSWREGSSALAAASAFAVKIKEEEFAALLPMAQRRLQRYGKPLFSFTLDPVCLRPLLPREGRNNTPLLPEQYRDRPYILVSGVGRPEQVEQSAREFLGREPVQHFDFDDHHPYSAVDVQALLKMAAAPLPVVCTAKDAVKLKSFAEEWGNMPVWILETRVRFGSCLDFASEKINMLSFVEWWEHWWEGEQQKCSRCGSG